MEQPSSSSESSSPIKPATNHTVNNSYNNNNRLGLAQLNAINGTLRARRTNYNQYLIKYMVPEKILSHRTAKRITLQVKYAETKVTEHVPLEILLSYDLTHELIRKYLKRLSKGSRMEQKTLRTLISREPALSLLLNEYQR